MLSLSGLGEAFETVNVSPVNVLDGGSGFREGVQQHIPFGSELFCWKFLGKHGPLHLISN